jgi:hypothetical protein
MKKKLFFIKIKKTKTDPPAFAGGSVLVLAHQKLLILLIFKGYVLMAAYHT